MSVRRAWIATVVAAVVAVGVLVAVSLPVDVALEWALSVYQGYVGHFQEHPLLGLAVFFMAYVLVVGLGMPGSVPMAALAGGLFGLWKAAPLIIVANTLAATLAFGLARYLGREFVRRRYPESVAKVDAGVRRDGAYYLFFLRLAPVLPFTVTNVAMGLTAMPLWTFVWVTVIGRLPYNVLVVNAGSELGAVRSVGDVLTWDVVAGLALLGVLPLVARLAQKRLKKEEV